MRGLTTRVIGPGIVALAITLSIALGFGRVARAQDKRAEATRLALVIGNVTYPDATAPDKTVQSDAEQIAAALKAQHFTVDLELNLGRHAMQDTIDALLGKVTPGSVVALYFNGIGIQVARQTYLIPVDAQIWSQADVKRDGTSVEAVLAQLARKGAGVKIVILDAARRNPFERRFRAVPAGLAAVDAPDNTLVLMAETPGKPVAERTGDSSLFMRELVQRIEASVKSADQVFGDTRVAVSQTSKGEEVPWVASSLTESFSFGEGTEAQISGNTAAGTATEAKAVSNASRTFNPKDVFKDCPTCPEMVVIPSGTFTMGAASSSHDSPLRSVTVEHAFAMGRTPITFADWAACVAGGGCALKPDDRGWGTDTRPVINVSWADAQTYVAWLSRSTGHAYRLPSEAEWEYAARAGTTTLFSWGDTIGTHHANCRTCDTAQTKKTLPVASFPPNPFGLYDMGGNVAQWVEDCWNEDYKDAAADASARSSGDCNRRVLRGGSFTNAASDITPSTRFRQPSDARRPANGFRIVRDLP